MLVQDDEYLATADAIGTRVCRDALWADDRCNWIGASLTVVDGAWQTVQMSLGPDVYGGTAGVALFLARLAAASGDRVHRATALGAIRHAILHSDRVAPSVAISLYSGTVGIDYAALAVGESIGDDGLVESALARVERTLLVAREDQALDVVTGIAGAIPSLISIHRRYKRPNVLELALDLGRRLVAAGVRGEAGLSWPNPTMSATHHLTGFSHGTAGCAWALTELHAATGETEFLDAALEAFCYERHWFSVEHANWPDLRDASGYGGAGAPAGQPIYGMSWCHGAPGIGLSRLRTAELLPAYVTLTQEAETAIATTSRSLREALAWPATANFSLCHGLAGNAELLLLASVSRDAPEHRALAEDVGDVGVAMYERTMAAWPSGVNGGGETPGLMLGSAGTGYFYLRLSDPTHVPPVVMIHPDMDDRAARGGRDSSGEDEVLLDRVTVGAYAPVSRS